MPIYGDEPQSVFNARMTLSSSDPVNLADTDNATTLYLLPYEGQQIGLLGVGDVVIHELGTSGVSITNSSLDVLRVYDVFVYDSSGTLTLELTGWLQTTATNSPSSGSSVSISVPDTGSLAAGDLVSVTDGSNAEICIVESFVADTSITVATLAASYTSPKVNFLQERTTDIADSLVGKVKSGTTTRRYVGTLRTVSDSGTAKFADTASERLLWNAYNQVSKPGTAAESTSSWTYSGTTFQYANASSANRVDFVIGLDRTVQMAMLAMVDNDAFEGAVASIGLDRSDGSDANLFASGFSGNNAGVMRVVFPAFYDDNPGIGGHFFAWIEKAAAGTPTFYGSSAGGRATGLHRGMLV